MDTTGIIQLVVATILYSTLIAPNVKRMSDLKSEIADVSFPIKTDPEYAAESAKNMSTINSKLDQYSVAYAETQKFLKILYVAMAIVLASQAFPFIVALIKHEVISERDLTNIIITMAIFILLIIAMNIFITVPKKLRTFRWLSSIGIKPVYARAIFNPALEINSLGRNVRESNNHVHIKISSDIALYGYNIILTIENIQGSKLYYALAGRVSKSRYSGGGGSFYDDGRSRSLVDLAHSLSLKPGKYRVRLLMFETIFQGFATPSEVATDIEVTTSDATSEIVYIDLSTTKSDDYSYKVKNDRPFAVECEEDSKTGGVAKLLASERFQKRLTASSSIMVCMYDKNGAITYDRIHHALNPFRVWMKRLRLILRFKEKRSFKSSHLRVI